MTSPDVQLLGAAAIRELADRLGGSARPAHELAGALADADVVISCTGSTGLAVTLSDAADAQVARGGARQAYIDLALPRDVADEVSCVRGVAVLGLGDIGDRIFGTN